MKSKRILSLLLSLAVISGTAPAYVSANTEPAEDARVYFTVSDRGIIAADNDGKAMAGREVTVKDINLDGKLSYDEALRAAHREYNSESGYVSENTQYGVSISRLWGVDTGNTLLFINNEGILNDAGTETVLEGDKLTVSVNKDNTYYADWYTFFDSDTKTVKTGEEFTLTLKGHLGMAYTDEDKANVPIPEVSAGIWKDGAFVNWEEKTTDKDGMVSFAFNEAGTYYITADGTVKDTVTDWSNGGAEIEADCPIIAPVCVVTVENSAHKSITIKKNAESIDNGKVMAKKGDTFKLGAYDENGEEVTVVWESADESIAEVDESGVVTAKEKGSTTVTAVYNEGIKDSIEVVVEGERAPYFESLEFGTTALASGAWIKGETFSPEKLSYDLPIKNYSTSSLALQASTIYDTDKYTAVAQYTDANGKNRSVSVNSEKMTTLANQPFDNSVMTITLSDKNNPENKTVYTFNVSRPRDTTKTVKANGIVLAPKGRGLSATLYKGLAEGTMQKADENGSLTSGTGVSASQYYYRAFIYDNTDGFKLNLTASTAYAHVRYSIDGGVTWEETAQGGGVTNELELDESDTSKVVIQIIDDTAYNENIKNGKDGFFETEPTEYKVWIDKVRLNSPKILTAQSLGGDWYPNFDSDTYSYWLMTKNDGDAPVLTYTVAEGNTVKIGTTEQNADDEGKYTLTLGTLQTSVIVTSEDGNFTNTYKFGYKKKSAFDVPDKVVDYFCICSQYTNAGYGVNPEQTLAGGLKSLGNFGGYITYYYENPITDNPNNKYGMDFYVIGNGNEANINSMAELGQVYVSEDGSEWYALAGSEHYEDKAIWDYTITYTKGSDGKSYWTDNYGNSMDYAAKVWPSAANYYMNDAAKKDSYTYTGILFKGQSGSITGDSTSTGNFASSAKFGYADYYASNISGTTLEDVNSYVENPSKANGFDVAWAVDKEGMPVDVREKEFHYIKIATASNIYAGAFGEKSTEVGYVIRTSAKDGAVGKTASPSGVTISDGAESKTVNFTEGQNIYSVNLDSMKYVSVKVNGTHDEDNIYINNQRTLSGETADGFKVTKEKGETLVRVIVQNGDKEPAIYMLRLTSSAEEKNEIVEGFKINADGSVREAQTKDGKSYSANVGYRIDNISINLIADPKVTYTVNGKAPEESYKLDYGKNTFTVLAESADGNTETVVLTVTRENVPASTGKSITVQFTLYGDEKHGNSEVHTYKDNKSEMPVWIGQKSFTVDLGATVLDVFEKALSQEEPKLTWKNDGGNYIYQINGLSEFDNGALSGWMYQINGKYSDLGVGEQTLKNGDSIIFHYTDDYTKEQDLQNINSSSSGGGSTVTYTISFETNGGENIQSRKINKNGTVKEPSKPAKDGYIFDGWFEDRELTRKYDFNQKVTKSFTLYAKWLKKDDDTSNGNKKFSDVEKGAWYENAVNYVTENNLFNGVSETEFAPEGIMTRAMLVTVLWRMEKEPQADYILAFEDVMPSEWYTEAVRWASAENLVTGYDNKIFGTEDFITREQTAAILYRYAEYKDRDTKDKENTNILSYEDFDKISEYAVPALQWAVGTGLMKGKTNSTLNPSDNTTRGQVAEMLMRFLKAE